MQPLLLIKAFVMFGLAMWLSIACLNNMVDRGTNRLLIKNLLSMVLIREDAVLGQGLLKRAWRSTHYVDWILKGIILVQIAISLLLWCGGMAFVLKQANATLISDYALLCFMSFWLCFLCGGLWFGYWIKMGQVQIVHLTLLLVSLLSVIVIHLPLG